MKNIFRASGGCGCSRKSTDIIEPKPQKPTRQGGGKSISGRYCPKIQDSVAVVKDSNDPYLDFRRSMLQMIYEKEIYSREDLQQLLDCFLKLNSPFHHQTIIRAFMEILNGEEVLFPAVDGGGGGGGAHVKTLN